MNDKSMSKAAIMMLIVVTTAVASYEMFIRSRGLEVAYDDGPALWADKRSEVYGPKDKQVVFIGSSRIKYDLDIPTWETQTGLKAVQLAIVGSSPRPMLEDLANDPDFKGRLVIDVTEPLFFSDLPPYVENPNKNISYFHDRTLSQQASFELNRVLESQLVFLDKDNFSLNAQLDALMLESRPGVYAMPIFPAEFQRTDFNRQTIMTDRFVKDPEQIGIVCNVWKRLLDGPHGPPMTDAQIEAIVMSVKKCTDKIKSRGGEIVFVRTPSSGPFLMGETMGFHRQRFWDRLLKITNCDGIHFQDSPVTARLTCPEFSHLSRPDAILYTQAFVDQLHKKGWNVKAAERTHLKT